MALRPVGGSDSAAKIAAWSNTTTYGQNTVVLHANQMWTANVNSTTTEPGVSGWTVVPTSANTAVVVGPTAPANQNTILWVKTPS